MGVFGSETPGETEASLTRPRAMAFAKYTLAATGLVISVDLYFSCLDSGDVFVKACIWDDDGADAAPGTFKGATEEHNIRNMAAGWLEFAFASPVALAAGDWWLGLIDSGWSGGKRYYNAADANSSRYKTITDADYADLTNIDPFGTSTGQAYVFPCHANYDLPDVFTGLRVTHHITV